eukprot:TRINITY_DN45716_c0_g1_i1.p1 TRINITY_DN45716_c0_g1~~TRINITY_DN45716_c0_g1_i1.p1  ORF type:complete len:372 (+),score=38.58 TRINITY_DN45716_c0_g1_i1:38-1153(+)
MTACAPPEVAQLKSELWHVYTLLRDFFRLLKASVVAPEVVTSATFDLHWSALRRKAGAPAKPLQPLSLGKGSLFAALSDRFASTDQYDYLCIDLLDDLDWADFARAVCDRVSGFAAALQSHHVKETLLRPQETRRKMEAERKQVVTSLRELAANSDQPRAPHPPPLLPQMSPRIPPSPTAVAESRSSQPPLESRPPPVNSVKQLQSPETLQVKAPAPVPPIVPRLQLTPKEQDTPQPLAPGPASNFTTDAHVRGRAAEPPSTDDHKRAWSPARIRRTRSASPRDLQPSKSLRLDELPLRYDFCGHSYASFLKLDSPAGVSPRKQHRCTWCAQDSPIRALWICGDCGRQQEVATLLCSACSSKRRPWSSGIS